MLIKFDYLILMVELLIRSICCWESALIKMGVSATPLDSSPICSRCLGSLWSSLLDSSIGGASFDQPSPFSLLCSFCTFRELLLLIGNCSVEVNLFQFDWPTPGMPSV